MSKFFAIIGFAGSVASTFGWFGITPEAVGTTLYEQLYVLLPFACAGFGFMAGWNMKAKMMRDKDDSKNTQIAELESAAKELRSELANVRAENIALKSHLENAGIDSGQPARTASGRLNTSMAALEVIPPEMARAMLAAYRSGTRTIPYGEHESAVMESMDRGDWVFKLGYWEFLGQPIELNNTFTLWPNWRSFVDDERVLKRLNERAAEG